LQWNLLGFYDDAKPKGTIIDGLKTLGGMQELNNATRKLSVVVAIADPQNRKLVVSKINNTLINFPVLIHPLARSGSTDNVFKRGTLITAGVILTTGITLNEFVIINLSATLGHDVTVGAFTSVMPGVHVSGSVQIGENVLLGTGAVILQNLQIGNNTKVGAGAVVTRHVDSNVITIGVPARKR
jgi:sugar O-acyltransferase (sialic acid O-acetyltransferase NeuD family)